MVNYNIDVYLKHTEMENMYVRELIELVTNDVNGNTFNFTIYESDNLFDLTNKRVTLIVRSKSGTVVQENCKIVDAKQGKASITLAADMFMENSTYMAEVQIWEGINSRVTTLPFDYTVRLSLESDESIKADPRFSLLQVALQNVNDADNKSKEALRISKEAKAICDELVPKANTASQNAQEALDRALSVVTQEELANKVMAGGKEANFNFTGNKVVPDGLVSNASSFNNSNDFTLIAKINVKEKYSQDFAILEHREASKSGFAIVLYSNGEIAFRTFNGNTVKDTRLTSESLLELAILNSGGKYKAIVNGKTLELDTSTMVNYEGTIVIPSVSFEKTELLCLYSRSLPIRDVTRNFQVLNNSPALKGTEITDSEGNKSTLLFSSDGDHVAMRTGRTVEEEYMGVLATMGKEFTADVQGKISVSNGVKARLISGEIQGQTVKNICKQSTITVEADRMTINNTNKIDNIGYSFKNNTSKIIIAQIYNTATDTFKRVVTIQANSTLAISASNEYIRIIQCRFSDGWANTDVDKQAFSNTCLIIETGYIDKITSYIPFGINSTQAIINNNGNQFPIYESMIYGKTRILKEPKGTQNWSEISDSEARDTTKFDYKLDSVNGDLGSVYGESDLIYRGSKTKQNNSNEVVFVGNEDWKISSAVNDESLLRVWMVLDNSKPNTKCLSDNFIGANGLSSAIDFECIGIQGNGSNISIFIKKSRLATPDIEGFKKWLQEHPTTVRYQLAAPQEIPLTDEEFEAYDKYKKLILLPFAEDKLILNDDGSVTWNNVSERYTISGDEVFVNSPSYTNETVYGVYFTPNRNAKNLGKVFSNYFSYSLDVKAKICCSPSANGFILFTFDKTEVDSIEKAKQWFKTNTTSLIYETRDVRITHIPKEIVPTILTDKINILSVDSAVQPASFTAVIPTTDGVKKEYILTPVNGWSVNREFICKLKHDGSVELMGDVTAPGSYNTHLAILPPECRPSRKVIVSAFKGSVLVAVEINTDGTIKIPTTTTGAVSIDTSFRKDVR